MIYMLGLKFISSSKERVNKNGYVFQALSDTVSNEEIPEDDHLNQSWRDIKNYFLQENGAFINTEMMI